MPDQMNQQAFDDLRKTICPHYKGGLVPAQRPDTCEWQHVQHGSITICWATNLRNSSYAPEQGNG